MSDTAKLKELIGKRITDAEFNVRDGSLVLTFSDGSELTMRAVGEDVGASLDGRAIEAPWS